MMGSLNSGVSALTNFSMGMDVLGDNTANVNSIAFKSSRIDFTPAYGNIIARSVASAKGADSGSNSPSSQIGNGVQLSAVSVDYTQGSLQNTGRVTDLAIVGEGFFRVLDTVNNTSYATRAGNFRIDDRGYIVTQSGFRLQGLVNNKDYSYLKYGVTWNATDSRLVYTKVTLSGTITSGVGDLLTNFSWTIQQGGLGGTLSLGADVQALIAAGTLSLGNVTSNAPAIQSYTFDASGNLTFQLTTGDSFSGYQLLLMFFNDKQALTNEGQGLYSGFSAAGAKDFTKANSVPNAHGLGSIRVNALEMANVELATQFAHIITIQRSFQAAARIITVSDEILNEVVNLKR